jgi:hypothetical protein
MKTKTLIAISALVLFSCGQEDNTDTTKQDQEAYKNYVPEKPTEEEVTYYIEIPVCNSRKEEHLVYIPQQDDFLVCRNKKWMYLPLNETHDENNVEIPNSDNVNNINNTEEKE